MTRFLNAKLAVIFVATIFSFSSGLAFSHCDTMDGPVITAAKKALNEKNVNLVLPWVQKKDEEAIKTAFDKTIVVRKSGKEAAEIADNYFFETLVRIHRAGEGASFTGIKPAGSEMNKAVIAADKALETGNLEHLEKLLTETMKHNLHKSFQAAKAKKNYPANNVVEGREFVEAYIKFVHQAEGIFDVANMETAHGSDEKGSEHHHHE